MFGLLAGNVRDGGERVTEMSGGPLHAVSGKKIKRFFETYTYNCVKKKSQNFNFLFCFR
jgi:hypothetical protein